MRNKIVYNIVLVYGCLNRYHFNVKLVQSYELFLPPVTPRFSVEIG
jgi:hypothetical protein